MDEPALDRPNAWSLPLFRAGSIRIRIHVLFLVVAFGLVLRAGFETVSGHPVWLSALAIQGILFLSVVWHELCHVGAARLLGAESNLIVLWPLGGLSSHRRPGDDPGGDLPILVAGPLGNLCLCLVSGVGLLAAGFLPPVDPFWDPLGIADHQVTLQLAASPPITAAAGFWEVLTARVFWINWILFLFNVFVPALPLDCGEVIQTLVSGRNGLRSGVTAAVKASLCVLLGCAVVAVALNDVLGLVLALVIWVAARGRMMSLDFGQEASLDPGENGGAGEGDRFRDLNGLEVVEKGPSGSWWSRYREKAAAKRLEREAEARRQDEERMDGLLEKLHRLGREGLTAEEKRFMEGFASRCRQRQSGHQA